MKTIAYILFAIPPLYLVYIIALYFRAHAPFVTTARHYVSALAKEVTINQDTVLYDLGFGKGDFMFEVEKYHPKALKGYELSFLHVWYAKIKARLLGSQATFECKDFFKADIHDATMIYLFLVKEVVEKTWVKIKKECKPGTLVCILGDALDHETPLKKIMVEPNNPKSSWILVYKV